MIPKIIHCFWAEGPKTKLAEKCLASWRKFAPDWEIREWNLSNLSNLSNISNFCLAAVAARKWAMVSDWARMRVLKEFGGIYLDLDVELVKPIGELPDGEWVAGERTASGEVWMNPGSGIALEKDSPIAAGMLEKYVWLEFDPNREMMTWINESLKGLRGLRGSKGLEVLDPEVMSPIGVEKLLSLAEKMPEGLSDDEKCVIVRCIEATRPILLKAPTDESIRRFVRGYWDGDAKVVKEIVAWGVERVDSCVKNRFIGEIQTYRNSIRSILFHTRFRGPLKVLVIEQLNEILRNAVLFNKGRDGDETFYNLAHCLRYDPCDGSEVRDFIARVIIKETADGNRTWTIEFSNKKELTGMPTTGEAATVEVTRLKSPSTHTILKTIYAVNVARGLRVLPPEVMSPIGVDGKIRRTERTVGIHWYAMSWASPKRKIAKWLSWHGLRFVVDALLRMRRRIGKV